MIEKLTPNLIVDDVNRALDFYQDVLQFELVMAVPAHSQEILTTRPANRALAFAIIKCGNVQLMLQSRESLLEELPAYGNRKGGAEVALYAEVADVMGLYARVARRATVIAEPQTKFYGKREFTIADASGNLLSFAGNP